MSKQINHKPADKSGNSEGKGAKKFPAIFWVIFAALIIFNLSVFFDYSKPLDRYARFAKIDHKVHLKAESVLHDVSRQGNFLKQCRLTGQGTLEWQSAEGNFASYRLKTVTSQQGLQKEDSCLTGDIVKVDFTNDDNANTLLVLLSIDFSDPFGNAKEVGQ